MSWSDTIGDGGWDGQIRGASGTTSLATEMTTNGDAQWDPLKSVLHLTITLSLLA